MRIAVAIMVGSLGCKGVLGIEDGTIVDAGSDVIDDAAACFGTEPYVVCPGDAGAPFIPLSTTVIDTDRDCTFVDMTDGRDWCVIVAPDITISTVVRANGHRPLVLLARGPLTIAEGGTIDVAGRAGMIAPNANPSICYPLDGMTGGGAGAGGTFGTAGGDGGNGFSGGGAKATAPPIGDELRGGCDGGRGAGNNAMLAASGRGGGAIYLLAGERLRVEGTINASGGGGERGKLVLAGGGGGGGGSGGMILLGAPNIVVADTAAVFANGGGGGGGSSIVTAGTDGATAVSPTVGGLSGIGGGAMGAAGGSGAASTAKGVNGISCGSAQNDSGGGGGGGGVGRMRIFASEQFLATTALSPPPS